MKGIRWTTLFAACLLVAAVGIAAADEKKEEAKMAKPKSGDVGATLEANERAIWQTFKNRDGAGFLALVDKDGKGADAMGFNKASTVPDMMKDYELRSYDMRDLETTMVSKDVYLLTYTANQDASYKGQAIPALPFYISSLYAKRGSKWICVYHQESMGMPAATATGN